MICKVRIFVCAVLAEAKALLRQDLVSVSNCRQLT